MKIIPFIKRLTDHPVMLYMSGCVFLLLSAFLLLEHVITVQQIASVQIPVLTEIPVLKRQVRILEDQIHVAQMQAFLVGDSEEEIVRMYVIPPQEDYHRIFGFFDALEEWMQKQNDTKDVVSLQIGESRNMEVPLSDGGTEPVSVHPLTVTFETSEDLVEDVSRFIQLAGFLSVGDVLREKDLLHLLAMTEEENPSSIVAIEQFFGTDLLQYSKNPRSFEEQVRRSFASESLLAAFESVLKNALEPIHTLLGGRAGEILESFDVWPSRLFVIQSIASRTLSNGRVRFHIELEAYSRS